MKNLIFVAVCVAVGAMGIIGGWALAGAPGSPGTPGTLGTQASAQAPASAKERYSYFIGSSIASGLKEDGLPAVDLGQLFHGFSDAYQGKPPAMNEAQMREAQMDLMREQQATAQVQQAARAAALKPLADKNLAEGTAFLAANKTKEGIVTTASGLQYKIIKEGTGPKPAASDNVVTHYKGTFIDGKQFDSSYDRGQPAEFPVGGVIQGWVEALQLMPVGSKWQLFIPSDLAYGPNGRGDSMPPNAVLLFDIELLEIKPK